MLQFVFRNRMLQLQNRFDILFLLLIVVKGLDAAPACKNTITCSQQQAK